MSKPGQTLLLASGPDNWFTEYRVQHQIYYPEEINFYLSGSWQEEIYEIRLNYSFANSSVWSYKYVDPSSYGKNGFEVALNPTGSKYIPPGTKITYFFDLVSISGKTHTSNQDEFYYLDPSVQWQYATSKHLTLIWHDRNRNDIESIAKKGIKSNLELTKILNLPNPNPITGVIVNNRAEARKSFPTISKAANREELYGGFAFSDYDTFVVIGTSLDGIIHESTHLLVNQSLNPTTRLPAWLSEGLAMHFEESKRETEQILQAYSPDQVFDLRYMNTVPGKPSDVRLFYLMSESFVGFLFSKYGDNKMKELISKIDSGSPIDEAIFATYGDSIPKLQTTWLNSFSDRYENKIDVDIGSFGTSLILSIAFIIGLFFSILGWLKHRMSDSNSDDHLRSDEYEEGYWDK